MTCSVLHDGFYPGALCTYGITPTWKAGGLYTLVKEVYPGGVGFLFWEKKGTHDVIPDWGRN